MAMDWNDTEDENFTDSVFDEENLDGQFNVFTVLNTILMICGIFENVVIFWILVRKKKCLKNFSNFHLLNLAVTDVLFRIVSTSDLLIEPIGASDVGCKVVEFGKYTTLAVTFSLLAGIAFDRYIHIVHPFKGRGITWKQSRNLVAASWIYGAVCSAPFLYNSKSSVIDDESLEEFWFCYDVSDLSFQLSITVFLAVCSFLIPLIFMGVAYGQILRFLWKRARNRLINSQFAKAKFRAVKMMVLIVLTYLVTWGPNLIFETMDAFGFMLDHASMSEMTEYELEEFFATYFLILAVLRTLTFVSSVLNPLIFGYYNRSFRDELKRFCCRKTCRQCFQKRKQELCPYLEKRGPRRFN